MSVSRTRRANLVTRLLSNLPICFLLALFTGCRQSNSSKPQQASLAAYGKPIEGSPSPEVVHVTHIEDVDHWKHVMVSNARGSFVLACQYEADDEAHVFKSCKPPRGGQDYLLFRGDTKWMVPGGTEPISLAFMEDYTVKYKDSENIGLLSTTKDEMPYFGVYKLVSWSGNAQ